MLRLPDYQKKKKYAQGNIVSLLYTRFVLKKSLYAQENTAPLLLYA